MEDEFILDMSKTYIYEDVEYILTGRKATKTIPAPPPPPRRRSRRKQDIIEVGEPKEILMVEIQVAPPRDNLHPPALPSTQRKWVNYEHLFIVEDLLE